MTSPNPCPTCGHPLSGVDSGLGGLCQQCLLQTTLKIDGSTPTPGIGDLFAALEAETNLVPHLSGFADYEFLEEIARGGMGIVFKARHRGLNRIVALKMIAAGQLAKAEELVRFRHEAEATARFQHPNLVAVYEVGEHDGQPWFSMEYVAGPSLAKVVREGPLVPERAARLLKSVADAVQHAHDHGILHRDLKPSNILLAPGDQPRVTDFGLAKFAQRDSELTRTDGILGSPSYMSPEQASAGVIDGRSDVYSLGAVLYELLTGRPPFQASTPVRTLRLVVETDPVAPTRLNPGVPRDLETICLKCLTKDPARRYASARDLAADLAAFLEGRPISARPVSVLERLVRWCRRKPALASTLLALGLALGIGVAGVLWQWQRAEALAHRESQQRRLADRNAYAADMLLIDRAMKDRNFGYVAGLLARHDPGSTGLPDGGTRGGDFRNWEWRHFQSRLPSDELFTLGVCSNRICALAVSPDGRLVAAGESDGWISIWDATTRTQRQRLPGPVLLDQLVFSPDQRWLACSTRDGSTRLVNTTNWGVDFTFQSPNTATPAFSKDSQQLHLGARGQLSVHDLADGKTVRSVALPGLASLAFDAFARHFAMLLWNGDGCFLELPSLIGTTNRQPDLVTRYLVSLSLSPDGRYAAATYNDNAVWVWDFRTGAVKHELHDHKALVFRTAFSPDNRLLATAGTDQVIGLWNVETGSQIGLLQGHRAAVTAVNFFPDGRRLVSGSRDGTVRIWDLTKTSRTREPIRSLGDSTEYLLSPDGSLIWHGTARRHWQISDPFSAMKILAEGNDPHVLSGAGGDRQECFALARDDGSVEHWVRTNGTYLVGRRLAAHPNAVKSMAYSPKNQYLASVGPDESLAIWEVATGALLKRIPGFTKLKRPGLPRFSFDGQSLTQEDSQAGSAVLDWPNARWHGPFGGQSDSVSDSVLSPDGYHLAVVSFVGGARVWDTRHPELPSRHLAAPDTGIWSTCYFPDGERLAVALDSGEIVLWDVVTEREVVRLLEEPFPAFVMAFNPEHDSLVTVNSRGLRIWRGRNGALKP